MICDMDCFHCKYPDCVLNHAKMTPWEKEAYRYAHSANAGLSKEQIRERARQRYKEAKRKGDTVD